MKVDDFAEKRDALMVKIDAFMDEVYPKDFISNFNRKQVVLICACYIVREELEREAKRGK